MNTVPNYIKKPSYWHLASQELKNKDHPIQDIVYLDQDYRTFKYFLTGNFDNDGPFHEAKAAVSSSSKLKP